MFRVCTNCPADITALTSLALNGTGIFGKNMDFVKAKCARNIDSYIMRACVASLDVKKVIEHGYCGTCSPETGVQFEDQKMVMCVSGNLDVGCHDYY